MFKSFNPNFASMVIGSFPHKNYQKVLKLIFRGSIDIPCCPQLPNHSFLEDMRLQSAFFLFPLISVNFCDQSVLAFNGHSRETALALFFEKILIHRNKNFFFKSNSFIHFIKSLKKREKNDYVKSQNIGPLTLAASIIDPNTGKSFLHDAELLDALIEGLSLIIVLQIEEIKKYSKSVIFFLDEPFLAGCGSSFVLFKDISKILRKVIKKIREKTEVILGIHCCGNTDWGSLMNLDFDIISFDSINYGEYFLLYVDELRKFLDKGGAIAWGATPSLSHELRKNTDFYWKNLNKLIKDLESKNFSKELLIQKSLITPACGLASLKETECELVLKMTTNISNLAKNYFKN